MEQAGKIIAKMPTCAKCGIIIRPGEPCISCALAKAEEAEAILKTRELDIARLGGLLAYEDFTLARYDNEKAIRACDGFPDCNLYIYGPAGTGKTHLATGVARQLPGSSVLKPQRIYRIVRGNGRQSAEDEQASINRLVRQPILVIDDLGVDKRTDYSVSTLYEIIDGRIMAKKKGLIVTSNLSLDALAERLGDDRIASRLAGACRIVEISGADRRIK